MKWIVLRALWLAWVVYVCWDAVPHLLWPVGDGLDGVRRGSALTALPMAALALAVIALSFGVSRFWRRVLVILSALWALYFFASLVAGDEGVWWYARGIPFVGLVTSLFTLRLALPWKDGRAGP